VPGARGGIVNTGGGPRREGASAARARTTVRAATLDDLDTIVRFRLALLRSHEGNPVYGGLRDDAERRARHLFARQLESRDEVLLLAERDGQPVGCLRCVRSLNSPLLRPDEYAYVSSVYVVPAERRSGVLRALMAEAERWCAARGLTEMRLHNAADNAVAAATWQTLGFEVVEQFRRRALPRRGDR
jgi:ribosomal protein S18 acetylase RimI-like enzyme